MANKALKTMVGASIVAAGCGLAGCAGVMLVVASVGITAGSYLWDVQNTEKRYAKAINKGIEEVRRRVHLRVVKGGEGK